MSQQLEKNIQDSLKANPSNYHAVDPFTDATYRYPSAMAAIDGAKAGGFTGFYKNNDTLAISQDTSGQWVREDGKPLTEIQQEIDDKNLNAIKTRFALRHEIGGEFKGDRDMANADAHSYRQIDSPELKTQAAILMVGNSRDFPDYKEGLEKAIPAYPGTAKSVYDMAAKHEANSPELAEKGGTAAAEQPQQVSMKATLERQEDARLKEQVESFLRKRTRLERQEDATLDKESDARRETSAVHQNIVEGGGVHPPTDRPVPDDVKARFKHEPGNGSDRFYFKHDNSLTFEDKGAKLETNSDNEHVADAMVKIAEKRGWKEIKVSGSKAFKEEVYLEASKHNIKVKGYTPPEAVREKAERLKAAEVVSAIERKIHDSGFSREQQLIVMARVRENMEKHLAAAQERNALEPTPPPTRQENSRDLER